MAVAGGGEGVGGAPWFATHCVCCGAYLAGSWTKHGPECEIGWLIEDMKNGLVTAAAVEEIELRAYIERLEKEWP